jgi:DNA-binding winged helix-turn-helix (wHTH) protein/TolB-like protein
MSKELKAIYRFGRFRLDTTERVLFENDKIVPVQPKLFDTLLALVESNGRIVEKDELMTRVWPDSFVEENNLNKNISIIRKLLGEGIEGRAYIETIPKRGYRFVAAVHEISGAGDDLIVATRSSTHLVLEEEDDAPDESARQSAGNGLDTVVDIPAEPKLLSRWRAGYILRIGVTLAVMIGTIAAIYLLWPKPAPSGSRLRSIAVLPFKPLVADAHDELIEMGMSETLINRLSSIRELTVRPMSAVRGYTALDQDPIAAGREQSVDGVLDGNIQKTGDRIRVTVRLVSIKDGHTLWAEKFDQRLTDIFALQDSISERIASIVAVKLSGEEKALLTRHHTDNPEAYRLYLKGCLFLSQGTEQSANKALESFDQAIALDRNYSLAYVGKANVYSTYSSQYYVPAEAMPKAKAELQKALELDSQLPEAHHSMARIKQWFDWDRRGAEEEFHRAIELQPSFLDAIISYSGFLTQEKRFDECLVQLKRAEEVDPLSIYVIHNFGFVFYLMGEYDKSIEQYNKALGLSPKFEGALSGLGADYIEKGMYEEATAVIKRAIEFNPLDQYVSELGYAYAVSGRRDEATKQLETLERLSKHRYVSPVRIARIYAGLGEREKVFEWLNRAYVDRSDHLLNLGADPMFERFRLEPRFVVLLQRVGIWQ